MLSKNAQCIIVLLVVLAAVYFVFYSKESYGFINMLPTSPEVEAIEGRPDFDVVNWDGSILIGKGDIALSPGFGVGEGTVGFGRYGSSFMA